MEFLGGPAVKDPALSLLWRRFDPWPGNLCIPQACPPPPTKKKTEIMTGGMKQVG